MTTGHVGFRVGTRIGVSLAALALAAPALTGCGGSNEGPAYDPAATAKQIQDAVAAGLPTTEAILLGTLPHSTEARTEGLEIHDGMLYESTSLPGRSELRELDPKTGRLIRSVSLPAGTDGRGITVIGSLIWQLTPQDGVALQWNRETLNAGGRVPWTGEGRGLCHDTDSLIASDGSNLLRVVDRNGVKVQKVIDVRLRGVALAGLDELECLPGRVLANVSGTDWIVAISTENGQVRAAADVSEIVPAKLRGSREKVLNGIALLPGTDTFLLTGKFWPTMFRVRFAF